MYKKYSPKRHLKFRLLEPVIGTQLTDVEVREIFEKLDHNHDGEVNINELTSSMAEKITTDAKIMPVKK